MASGETLEITPAGKSERSPQWAPDGKTLAFLSNRGGKTQVYVITFTEGTAVPVTASRFGVDSFHWSPDGREIAYLAKDNGAADAEEGPQVADRDHNLPRLWLITVESGATRNLGKAGYRIDDFQWRNPWGNPG